MVVVEIAGMPGMGKTLFASYCALNFHKLGYTIYANYKIFNPITGEMISKNIETAENLENAHDGYLFLDEIAQYIDGRKAMTGVSKLVNNVLQKNRKRNLSLFFTCQDAYMVDIRLRLNSDYVCLPYQHYVINGKDINFKQNLFQPINTKLLLPYSQVHVDMLPAGKFFGKKDYTKYDVVQEFDILVEPIAKCYDTTEEIEDLIQPGAEQGEKREKFYCKKLQERFPYIKWYNTLRSGKDQMSFDIEGIYEDKTWIIDCSHTLYNPVSDTYILPLNKKSMQKFQEVEKLRDAKTFFMFDYRGKLYTVPTSRFWNITKKSKSINPLYEAGELEYIADNK